MCVECYYHELFNKTIFFYNKPHCFSKGLIFLYFESTSTQSKAIYGFPQGHRYMGSAAVDSGVCDQITPHLTWRFDFIKYF